MKKIIVNWIKSVGSTIEDASWVVYEGGQVKMGKQEMKGRKETNRRPVFSIEMMKQHQHWSLVIYIIFDHEHHQNVRSADTTTKHHSLIVVGHFCIWSCGKMCLGTANNNKSRPFRLSFVLSFIEIVWKRTNFPPSVIRQQSATTE